MRSICTITAAICELRIRGCPKPTPLPCCVVNIIPHVCFQFNQRAHLQPHVQEDQGSIANLKYNITIKKQKMNNNGELVPIWTEDSPVCCTEYDVVINWHNTQSRGQNVNHLWQFNVIPQPGKLTIPIPYPTFFILKLSPSRDRGKHFQYQANRFLTTISPFTGRS